MKDFNKNEAVRAITGLCTEDLTDTLQYIADTYLLFFMQDNQFEDERTTVYCHATQLRDIIMRLKA